MGGREEDSPDNERPAHQVHISSFYMDTYPVTNQDYREFVNCTGQTTPIHWGNRFVDGERCNSNNMIGTTLPVDEFPLGRSPFGIWDMSGNTYEWCGDYYEGNYYPFSPATNPKGPEGGQERVIRGGFFSETRPNVRTTHRNSAPETHTRENVGFRLAISDQDG